MEKIVVVLNDFEKIDDLLKKAIMLCQKHNSFLEVLYVHESPLFDLPDFFRAKESINDNVIDKDKVEKEIKERILKFGFTKNYAILVFDGEIIGSVLNQTREDKKALILIAYNKEFTHQLVKESDLPLLIIKNSVVDYKKIVLPINFSENTNKCINYANTIFPDSEKKLLHDYRYVDDTSVLDDDNFVMAAPNPILNAEINEEFKKNRLYEFEVLKKETGFEGDFIEESISLEDDLCTYIDMNHFDLTVLCLNKKQFLFSDSFCFSLLEKLSTDILIQG